MPTGPKFPWRQGEGREEKGEAVTYLMGFLIGEVIRSSPKLEEVWQGLW